MAQPTLEDRVSLSAAPNVSIMPTARAEVMAWRRTAYRRDRAASLDPLTGLIDREQFEETLVTEFKRAGRQSSVLGLIYLSCRRPAGADSHPDQKANDPLLAEIAARLRAQTRVGDLVARYGGDEFVIIVSDSCPAGIRQLAERVPGIVCSATDEIDGAKNSLEVAVAAACCVPLQSGSTFERFLSAIQEAIAAARSVQAQSVPVISLITEQDEKLLSAVREWTLSKFLEGRVTIDRQALQQASREASGNAFFIGRLARRLGWLSARRLKRILDRQRRTHQMFGELAQQFGYLRPRQLHALLAWQQENPRELMDVLVDRGHLSKDQAEEMLGQYLSFLKYGRTPRTGMFGARVSS